MKYYYLLKKTYSNLNMEAITDADYKHVKKVWKNFKTQHSGYCHDLYVQSDTLLVADACIEIYELVPAHFLSAPGLASQACLKQTKTE